MNKPKFQYGDCIYAAASEQTEKWIPCPLCEGKRFVNIVFNGVSHDIECPECERGYLGSTGTKQTWEYAVAVREGPVSKVEKGIWEPYEFEYGISAGYGSSWVIKESNAFSTKEEALSRSSELAAEHEAEQLKNLGAKESPNKSWAWNINYYKDRIKQAHKDIEYYTLKLDAGKKYAKEEK